MAKIVLMQKKEGNVLFNDTLNTFYLQLCRKEGNVLFNDTRDTFLLMVILAMPISHTKCSSGKLLAPW